MAGNELDADKLQPDKLMTTVRMVDWMKLNSETEKLREALNQLIAACRVPLIVLRSLNSITALKFKNAIDDARCAIKQEPLKKRNTKAKHKKE